MQILVQLLAAGLVMGALDFVWLGKIAQKLYRRELGDQLLKKPRMSAALAFYALYVVGIVVFAVRPADDKGWLVATGMGALFGLVAYATYDLTNRAVLKQYSLRLTLIDLAWGVFITATSAAAAYGTSVAWT